MATIEQGWTIDTLREHIYTTIKAGDDRQEALINNLRDTVQAEIKTLDARREERYTSLKTLEDAAVADLRTYLLSIIHADKAACDAALLAQERSHSAAMAAAAVAVSKSEAANEKRFDSVNEFREALGDQTRMLMPRMEAEVIYKGLNERISALVAVMADAASKMTATEAGRRGEGNGLSAGWGLAAGVVGLVMTVISVAMLILRGSK